jgi:hypothetical protein
MEIFSIISAFGLSSSAGLNAYIPLLVVSLLAKYTDLIKLSSTWDAMTSWWVIGTLIFLLIIEIVADKIPAVNHANDIVQSFIRPTAGAIVFAASASNITHVNTVLAIIAGLFISGSVHAVKSLAIRPTVTATTGGAGNVPASIAEDVASASVSILSIIVPIIAACLLILIIAFVTIILLKKKRNKKRLIFWKQVLKKSKDKTNLFSNIPPGKSSFIRTSAGKSGLTYSYTITQKNGSAEFCIDNGINQAELSKKIFNSLFEHKGDIEKEFGDSLEWESTNKKGVYKIRKIYPTANLNESVNWDELQGEMINGMINLDRALKKYLNDIKD